MPCTNAPITGATTRMCQTVPLPSILCGALIFFCFSFILIGARSVSDCRWSLYAYRVGARALRWECCSGAHSSSTVWHDKMTVMNHSLQRRNEAKSSAINVGGYSVWYVVHLRMASIYYTLLFWPGKKYRSVSRLDSCSAGAHRSTEFGSDLIMSQSSFISQQHHQPSV